MDALPSQRLAQLQAIYDGVPVGLCFLDRNLRYLSLNKRIARMNGVPAAAHLGRTVAEVIPDLFPRLERCIRRALNGKPTTGVEVRVPAARHGEKDQTLLISYQPVCDEAKEVLGVSMAIMDITEHRGIERALRESEDHYRSMVKLSPHIPWVLNIKGEITEPSPGWEALTGQTAEESVGTGWLKAIHPDDYGAAMETLQISIRTGQPIDTECRVRRSDGEWVWIRSRGSPRFGPTGRIVCFYGLVEEVHAQRQNTEELLAIKAKSRAALEAVPVGIIIADALDGAISMVNPAAKDILGDAVFPGQKLAEYGGWGLTHADGRVLEADEYPLARAILRGEAADVLQLLLQRSDGSQLNLSLSGKPIHSEEGQLIGGVMMIRTLDDAG
jgi:PAS domain S-box-containing protein